MARVDNSACHARKGAALPWCDSTSSRASHDLGASKESAERNKARAFARLRRSRLCQYGEGAAVASTMPHEEEARCANPHAQEDNNMIQASHQGASQENSQERSGTMGAARPISPRALEPLDNDDDNDAPLGVPPLGGVLEDS